MKRQKRTGLNRVSVHLQIADVLRDEIHKAYSPGDKFPSQNVLASRFGVSANTVREAISALVQEGLLERQHGSGTYVTERRRDGVVAVVYGNDITLPSTSYFWLRLIQSIRAFLENAGVPTRFYASLPGVDVNIGPSGEFRCPEFWRDVDAGVVRGVAAVSIDPGEWQERLEAQGILTLTAHSLSTAVQAKTARDMVVDTVDYLVQEHDCRRFGFIGWNDAAYPGQEYEGLTQALQKHQIAVNPAWVAHMGKPGLNMAGADGVRQVWEGADECPDALLVVDNLLVPAAVAELATRDLKIPGDLRVAVHTLRLAPAEPLPFPVVQMEVDPDAIAERYAEVFLRNLDGKDFGELAPCKGYAILPAD